ncbi:class I SAM-dependent methyltransferase [Massilia cavernae]|uniref:Class I SAM-dependent methyltransferase n=1 Tax=Massilia cavernae TaxID=2320864 RepID=A0A418Y4V9_9BURK|nr:class I SAM-dependent methyltransferase [Massilia cavernae]RJG21100.1 class I SAM-dependent methyltransferase [Massilia cavernae]
MQVAIAALLVFLVLVSLYTLHKVRAIHLMQYSASGQLGAETGSMYRQLEALQGLYIDLDLKKSLPSTRGWAASPDFLAELAQYALAEKPRTVVECSSGTSTLVLARCMQINGGGKVYSLEHDPVFALQTRAHLERHGLSDFAEVIDAPLKKVEVGSSPWSWYAHEGLPADIKIDLLAIDGPPSASGELARYPAGPVLFPLLSANGAVFLDDASRVDEQAILSRWKQEFPALSQTMRFCEKGCAVLRSGAAA